MGNLSWSFLCHLFQGNDGGKLISLNQRGHLEGRSVTGLILCFLAFKDLESLEWCCRKLNYFHPCNTETKLEHNSEALIGIPSGCCSHSFSELAKPSEEHRSTKQCRKAHKASGRCLWSLSHLLPLQKKRKLICSFAFH